MADTDNKQALASASALDNVDDNNDENIDKIEAIQSTIDDKPKEDNEEKEEKEDKAKEHADEVLKKYNAADDAMHVEFDEEQWIPCIPGLSLTAATLICAIVGAAIGLAIALTGPEPYDEITVMTMTTEAPMGGMYGGPTYNVTTIETIQESNLSEEWEAIIQFPGKIWVAALKLLVLPLIILMMVVLPSRVAEIGFIGKRAVPLYLFTSTCAAIEGTIWAWIIKPGEIGRKTENIEAVSLSSSDVSPMDAFLNVFYNLVPANIVVAMYGLQILGCITFFITIGILLRNKSVKEVERNAVLNFSKAILRCCMMAIVWVVWFTPVGMMFLIMHKIATTENLAELLAALGFYVLCVLIGHSIHLFAVYPAVFFATTRGNGWKWFAKIYPAPLLAFATSSSAATLPRSLTVADAAGVREDIYSFILPLGAAINMDGTALGFPIMVALIAQLNDIAVGADTVMIIMLLSVVVSVGTAPIPNAGMVYLTMLFTAAGFADDVIEDGIATLFVLDWFVDRIETAVNVTSDQFVAKIIDEVDKNAKKKNVKVVLGCCIGSGDPNDDGYEQPESQMKNNEATTQV